MFNTAVRFGVGAFESAKMSEELQRKRLDRERLRKYRYKMRLQRGDAQNEASKTMLVPSTDTNPGSLPVCLSASGWTPQVNFSFFKPNFSFPSFGIPSDLTHFRSLRDFQMFCPRALLHLLRALFGHSSSLLCQKICVLDR